MKNMLLGLSLLLAACSTIPVDQNGNPVPQPITPAFSWVTFCTIDVPGAQFLYSMYKIFGKVSERDQARIDAAFTNVNAMCVMGANNVADAQTRASMELARVNDTLKNPNLSPAPNVIPLKAK